MRWHSVVTIMYEDMITLIKQTDTTDEYGDSVTTKTERSVYVETMSISQKEFYQANEQGLKPEMKFKLADYEDYQNEQIVRYGEFVYKVLRTYKTQRNELEITVHGGVKDVSS